MDPYLPLRHLHPGVVSADDLSFDSIRRVVSAMFLYLEPGVVDALGFSRDLDQLARRFEEAFPKKFPPGLAAQKHEACAMRNWMREPLRPVYLPFLVYLITHACQWTGKGSLMLLSGQLRQLHHLS